MEYSLRDFLEMFRNADLDVEKYFNNYETFFSLLNKKGLMDDVDPSDASDGDDWENHYLIWLYNNDRPKFYEWVQNVLGDITIEGKEVFWEGDREDLAQLFCDGHRYDLSQDSIRSILKGEDVFEPYWDTTDDIYRDVVEELTPENLEYFKKRVLEELSGKQLSPDTNEMEMIASEQGHDDFFEITKDNVSRLIDDEDSMKSLFENELSEIKSDLYSIHSNSFNSAYETDVYKSIFHELDDFFVSDKGEFVYTPHPYKKDVKVEKYKLPIRNFEGLIVDYLDNNKNYGNSGTLGYHGGFLEILYTDKDCLSVRVSDYPDSREVDKNINSYFRDFF
jgi:hypothetical protein